MSKNEESRNNAERIPPQNLDAEKSLLGAILISEDCLADVTEIEITLG